MNMNKKSRLTSLLLTILLGPLGLMYSSAVGGVVLLIIACASWWTIIGLIICWVLSIIIGDHMTYRHNQGINAFISAINKDK